MGGLATHGNSKFQGFAVNGTFDVDGASGVITTGDCAAFMFSDTAVTVTIGSVSKTWPAQRVFIFGDDVKTVTVSDYGTETTCFIM